MDEIRREAMNNYQKGTEEQKRRAWEFFKAMDSDGSGSISIHELVAFLRKNGLYDDNFYLLFTELDKDNNGVLDFEEFITLFFMLTDDKYRDRFAGTTWNVNIDKEIKDRSILYQDESRGIGTNAIKGLKLFMSVLEAAGIDTGADGTDECSIM